VSRTSKAAAALGRLGGRTRTPARQAAARAAGAAKAARATGGTGERWQLRLRLTEAERLAALALGGAPWVARAVAEALAGSGIEPVPCRPGTGRWAVTLALSPEQRRAVVARGGARWVDAVVLAAL